MTSSLVAGILNAPWKTNEDRQNLLSGPYNEELIEAVATLIADSLPALATKDDPARHLDTLPRRQQADDSEQVNLLRERLFDDLRERDIVPDEEGLLRRVRNAPLPSEGIHSGQANDCGASGALGGFVGTPAGLAPSQGYDCQSVGGSRPPAPRRTRSRSIAIGMVGGTGQRRLGTTTR